MSIIMTPHMDRNPVVPTVVLMSPGCNVNSVTLIILASVTMIVVKTAVVAWTQCLMCPVMSVMGKVAGGSVYQNAMMQRKEA